MSGRVSQKYVLAVAVLLAAIGALGFFHSLTVPAYKNETLYLDQYRDISVEGSYEAATQEFRKLRDGQLTEKYKVQDYSLTVLFSALALLGFVLLGGVQAACLKSKTQIALLGVASALTTSAASLFSLLLDFNRGEFPWWADSLGIPLFTQEVPILLVLLIWAVSHLYFLKGHFEYGRTIFRFSVFEGNLWLSSISFISLLFLIDSVAKGSFVMIIPGCLWIYFYLCLASGRDDLKLQKMTGREF